MRADRSPADIPIEDVVPHRGAMLLVDRLIFCDDDNVVVEADVGAGNQFADDTGVPAWVGIEYMAQAIAAWAGYRALARQETVKLGFLLGTRRYTCARSVFAFGLRLRIEGHRELFGENGLGLFACRILDGDEEIATANVSVFEPQNPEAFLEGQQP
ncbi:MAG TPA: hotdog family protein [Arenimonas sp.]|uniref:hotdog family protein n=1 Tax=Arenimonas sp. TaxID=1872635 RepID=UPI002C6EABA2|nr:hotdog family protein [Arenimonas sp.]HMB57059.1 hotdog family protein [Arenimonas sp.]